jgi:sulfatase maturation enzyme AslB (radical SAM superfamily)
MKPEPIGGEAPHQEGLKLFGDGRATEAIPLFEEALGAGATSERWNDWAVAEMACGNTDKAEEGFRHALALKREDSHATANLGVLLATLGRVQEAIPLLTQAAAGIDEPQRMAVRQLIAHCRVKLASDLLKQSHAIIQSLASGRPPSSRLRQDEPVSAAGDLAPSALGKFVLVHGPKALTLESSSVCNLRCVMCPQGRDLVHRPRHFPSSLIEKLQPAVAGVKWIQLHGIGEPLLSPAFWQFLEKLRLREEAHIEVNTNMTVITDDQIDRIVQSRLSLINVSLDAATAETYLRIRGYDFHKVVNNLRRLISRRNAEGREKPAIFLNMTLMRENIEELEAFVRLAHDLGVQGIQFWHLNAGEDYRLTKKDGWTFDYKTQMLSNYPELSNTKIRAAVALAECLGTPFRLNPSKDLFFEETFCG